MAFTRDGQETIEPYIKNTSLAELVEVHTAEVSLAELETTQHEVTQMIDDLGFSFLLGINVQKNQVELEITDQALWEASLQQAGLRLPEHVEVIVTYVPLGDDRPFGLTPIPDVFLPQCPPYCGPSTHCETVTRSCCPPSRPRSPGWPVISGRRGLRRDLTFDISYLTLRDDCQAPLYPERDDCSCQHNTPLA